MACPWAPTQSRCDAVILSARFWSKQCPCWINYGIGDGSPAGVNMACGVKGNRACAEIFRDIKKQRTGADSECIIATGESVRQPSISLLCSRSRMCCAGTVKHLAEKRRGLLTTCLTDLSAFVVSVSAFRKPDFISVRQAKQVCVCLRIWIHQCGRYGGLKILLCGSFHSDGVVWVCHVFIKVFMKETQ